MAKKQGKAKPVQPVLPPPPYPLAMVVCDYVHRDPATGKPFLLGCFSVITVTSLPSKHAQLGLYIELTNGRGTIPYKIEIVDADEEYDPVWTMQGDLQMSDPRTVGQLILMIGGIVFERAGEYRIQLSACNEFLMERRVIVHLLENTEEKR